MDTFDDFEDSIDINPRSVGHVIQRLRVLEALCLRATLEQQGAEHESGVGTQRADQFDLMADLIDRKADVELTLSERDFMMADIGSLDEQDIFDAAWSVESLGILLAIAGVIISLPSPPLILDSGEVMARAEETLKRDPGELIRIPSPERLESDRERIEIQQWRAIAERELRSATPAESDRIRTEILEVSEECQRAQLDVLTIEGDLTAAERPIATWTDEDLDLFEMATSRRLHALNWLCGLSDAWDTTPLVV